VPCCDLHERRYLHRAAQDAWGATPLPGSTAVIHNLSQIYCIGGQGAEDSSHRSKVEMGVRSGGSELTSFA
jgi:hypothetical protein